MYQKLNIGENILKLWHTNVQSQHKDYELYNKSSILYNYKLFVSLNIYL